MASEEIGHGKGGGPGSLYMDVGIADGMLFDWTLNGGQTLFRHREATPDIPRAGRQFLPG